MGEVGVAGLIGRKGAYAVLRQQLRIPPLALGVAEERAIVVQVGDVRGEIRIICGRTPVASLVIHPECTIRRMSGSDECLVCIGSDAVDLAVLHRGEFQFVGDRAAQKGAWRPVSVGGIADILDIEEDRTTAQCLFVEGKLSADTVLERITARSQYGNCSCGIGMIKFEGHLVIDSSFLHQAAKTSLSESVLQDVEVVGAQLVDGDADDESRHRLVFTTAHTGSRVALVSSNNIGWQRLERRQQQGQLGKCLYLCLMGVHIPFKPLEPFKLLKPLRTLSEANCQTSCSCGATGSPTAEGRREDNIVR